MAMKWPNASAKHPASIADALATVTPRLVKDNRGAPAPRILRTALYSWAFRLVLDQDGDLVARIEAEEAPEAIVAALDGIGRKSVDIAALNTPTVVWSALDSLARKMDGTAAADNTVTRKVPVFSNCLRYAVEMDRLPSLPLTKVDWTPPETDDEIDFRYVPGPDLARKLIDAVGEQGDRGRHLKAFFGCLYYTATRPGEAVALRETDFTLPEEGWGQVVLSSSSPRVGSGWTDSGESYDSRGLKKRARKATREVPMPPDLVRLIRNHIAEFGTGEGGRLFRAARGGGLLSKEYGDIWKAARRAVLAKEEAKTPLAEVPYGLRAAGVSLWLESGVSPAEVARRAVPPLRQGDPPQRGPREPTDRTRSAFEVGRDGDSASRMVGVHTPAIRGGLALRNHHVKCSGNHDERPDGGRQSAYCRSRNRRRACDCHDHCPPQGEALRLPLHFI
ncbi:site-specific integrase [Streptomyces sp. ISL-66]|uniref:tyrosine-type recombinase/integrase n=1 Tax=Streptomyces sp. ISL-66 TaxID=2819186 RepID=UPI002552D6E4|nr:site-specific integrase [Streptomyces sp. ISL-66]